jgi:hypothetical protein
MNVILWVAIGVVITGGLLAFFVFDVGTSPDSLPVCNVLQEGEGPGLVFFGTKEQTERYMDALYAVKPFDEARERLKVSYIDSVKPLCELYKGIALLCYSRELVVQAGACEYEYIVVLEEHPSSIRSSAFEDVMSINTAHQPSVFAHEFGHSFADFAEEYTPASLPRSSDNCQASCEAFDFADGCYQGCSEEGYYRSIDAGIMRTLSATRFGTWHESYLRDLLDLSSPSSAPVTGFAVAPSDCASQEYALVHLRKDASGIFQVTDVRSERGCSLPTSTVETSSFHIFTDVQEITAQQLRGDLFAYEGDLFIPISSTVTTLTITKDGQLTGEVHLGATLCRA